MRCLAMAFAPGRGAALCRNLALQSIARIIAAEVRRGQRTMPRFGAASRGRESGPQVRRLTGNRLAGRKIMRRQGRDRGVGAAVSGGDTHPDASGFIRPGREARADQPAVRVKLRGSAVSPRQSCARPRQIRRAAVTAAGPRKVRFPTLPPVDRCLLFGCPPLRVFLRSTGSQAARPSSCPRTNLRLPPETFFSPIRRSLATPPSGTDQNAPNAPAYRDL
jgi:hypothetical protein